MNQKGQTQVLILAGIVLVIAVAGGIFFLGRITLPRQDSSGQAAPKPQTPVVAPQPSSTPSPTTTPDPTANWKTYTNTKYGFTLEYPNDWVVKSENKTVDSSTTRTTIQSSDLAIEEINIPGVGGEQVINGSKLEISASNNENFTSYEQLKDFMENEYTGFPLNYFTSSKEIIVDGIKSTIKSGRKIRTLALGSSFVYFFKDGVTYNLTFTNSQDDDRIFNQILSTFKFLP